MQAYLQNRKSKHEIRKTFQDSNFVLRASNLRAPRGIVSMLTIFVFMAVLISIAATVAIVGQDQIALAGVYQDGEQAFAVADACAEEGFNQLKQSASFTGETFGVAGGTCVVSVVNISGNNYLITGNGTYHNSLRIVQVNVNRKSNGSGNAKKITINSWHEAD